MSLPLVPRPDEIGPIDPDKFREAYEYAMMVADNEFLEHVPAVGRPIIEHEDKQFALSNSFETRFSVAAFRHFDDEDTGRLFMWRIPALFVILDHPQIDKYCIEQEGERSVHSAVIEVAAAHLLNDSCRFTPASFFAEVDRVLERTQI